MIVVTWRSQQLNAVSSLLLVLSLFPSQHGERAHPDLNQGPADLQSAALATELCTHVALQLGSRNPNARLPRRRSASRPLPFVTRPCGLMDKALVFGTKDCRFESCQGHTSTEFDLHIASQAGT